MLCGSLPFTPTFAPVLKYPVTILLILLIALQTFSKWALILEYRVNRDFIAKNLCVNRDIISCCAGKCYLNKKLAKDEAPEQGPGKSAQKETSPLQLFFLQTNTPDHLPMVADFSHSTRWLPGCSQEHILSFFEPPQV
ncbi:MAG TPA: hypothetical protein VK563_06480 [Puia sp.]|nr:hypothetical protein [Puia sp.]